jgi:hypothetical protein
MAHGTCGEQFKAAFSCFVYSEQEPKGVECIERFKEMQDCFKEHPEEYGQHSAPHSLLPKKTKKKKKKLKHSKLGNMNFQVPRLLHYMTYFFWVMIRSRVGGW